MAVTAFALTDVGTLSMYLDNPVRAGIDIYHDESASATAATVEVTATTLELVITGGANAGTDSLSLTTGANDTLGELVDVINALSKGWVASLSGGGSPDALSDDLVIVAAVSAFALAEQQTLNIRDVALMELVIDEASGTIERFLDRNVLNRSYADWVHWRSGREIVLRQRPVTAVNRIAFGRRSSMTVQNTNTTPTTRALVSITSTAVVCKRVTSGVETTDGTLTFAANVTITAMVAAIDALGNGWDAAVQDTLGDYPSADLASMGGAFCLRSKVNLEIPSDEISDYRFDEKTGIIYFGSVLSFGLGFHGGGVGLGSRGSRLNIFVDYVAGWLTTDVEAITIKGIATAFAAKLYANSKANEGFKREKLGDYEYERSENASDNMLGEFKDSLYQFVAHTVIGV